MRYVKRILKCFQNIHNLRYYIYISQCVIYNNITGVDFMRIKEIRSEKGIMQKQIAQDLNIPQNTFSQYEN